MSFDQNAVFDKTCVRFTMPRADGDCSAAVSAKALVEHFGADMNEQSLLDTYRENFKTIHTVARRLDATTLDRGVLVTEADLVAASH
jgi:hypothetical protein